MVFGLGRKQHKVKVTARGRGTAPPPELMVPNALIPTAMPPAPLAAPIVAPTYSTVTTLPYMPPVAPPPVVAPVMAPMAPVVAPPVAAPVVGVTPPVVTTETLAVQYPTESRVMPYAPPTLVEETTVYQPPPPPPEAPIELSIQRVQPPLPAGYESDEEYLQRVKYAQKDVLTDDDTDSYTSFEEEVYCIVPPGSRIPRDMPLNSYRHGYRMRGGQEVIDQYYEGPTPSPRQSLPRRSELYSYTDIPVARNATRYSPSPRLEGVSARAYRGQRIDASPSYNSPSANYNSPSPSYNRRGRYY